MTKADYRAEWLACLKLLPNMVDLRVNGCTMMADGNNQRQEQACYQVRFWVRFGVRFCPCVYWSRLPWRPLWKTRTGLLNQVQHASTIELPYCNYIG